MAINYSRLRNRAHDLLNGQTEPPVDVEAIAETLGASVRALDMEMDVAGVLYRQGDHKVIAVNQMHPLTRRRFTIAHEIGHLVLHRGVPVHVDQGFRINLRDPSSAQGQEIEEIEANAFAANLLMPFYWLRNDLRADLIDLDDSSEVKELAERYQVSQQAMLIRLTTLFGTSASSKKLETKRSGKDE